MNAAMTPKWAAVHTAALSSGSPASLLTGAHRALTTWFMHAQDADITDTVWLVDKDNKMTHSTALEARLTLAYRTSGLFTSDAQITHFDSAAFICVSSQDLALKFWKPAFSYQDGEGVCAVVLLRRQPVMPLQLAQHHHQDSLIRVQGSHHMDTCIHVIVDSQSHWARQGT